MTPTHAQKSGRHCRYYISRTASDDATPVLRLAAREIEAAVIQGLIGWFRDRPRLAGIIDDPDMYLDQLVRSTSAYVEVLEGGSASAQQELLLELGCRIEIGDAEMAIALSLADAPAHLLVPITLTRVGIEMRMILANETVNNARRDPALIGLLVRAHPAQATLAIEADRTKVEKDQLSRLTRLTYPASDIVGAILAGRQPASLTARTLARVGKLPIGWADQRHTLGF